MKNRTLTQATQRLKRRYLSIPARRSGICVALALALAGCEAPLELSGVEAQLAKPVQRSDLFQAAARHQDSVIIVGSMGVVVHSVDGGDSWQRTVLPGKPFLVDVAVCPDGSFHAVEKADGLWTLQPAGDWTRHDLPEMTEAQAMTCDEQNTLWVTGGFSTILHSADAGASWESWSLDEDLFLTTIQFVDQLHGFATGEFGIVLVSSDGGMSWERASDLPDSFYPQDAYFTSPTSGWIVGLDGIIWKTDTAGDAWEQMPSGINTPLYGLAGSDGSLLAVGDNSTVLHNSVGAATWQPVENANTSRTYLRAVTGLSKGRFVVAGGGSLFTVTLPDGAGPVSKDARDD